jgi:hypothetical protein
MNMTAAGNRFILCDKISGVPAYTPYNGISGKWLRAKRTFLGVLPQDPMYGIILYILMRHDKVPCLKKSRGRQKAQ